MKCTVIAYEIPSGKERFRLRMATKRLARQLLKSIGIAYRVRILKGHI